MSKPSLSLPLLLLLIVTISVSQKSTLTEARTASFLPKKYSKIFPTLGVVCKCCDDIGTEGECPTTWEGPCHDLQCLPWKIG